MRELAYEVVVTALVKCGCVVAWEHERYISVARGDMIIAHIPKPPLAPNVAVNTQRRLLRVFHIREQDYLDAIVRA